MMKKNRLAASFSLKLGGMVLVSVYNMQTNPANGKKGQYLKKCPNTRLTNKKQRKSTKYTPLA
jgi:hypothetical protein